MQQKTNWMRYLIIGISFMVILSFTKCKKTIEPNLKTGNYIYVNNTSDDILMEIYDRKLSELRGEIIVNSYVIPVGDSLAFQMKSEFAFPFYSEVKAAITGDSVIIKKDTKCIVNYYNETNGIDGNGVFKFKNYDNYSAGIETQIVFTLYYTFKEQDFDLATMCK